MTNLDSHVLRYGCSWGWIGRCMFEIVLEILALISVATLIGCVIYTGISRKFTNDGWNWIVVGLGLLFIGALVDVTDNFPALSYLVVVGNTPTQTFFESFLGKTLAYVFLCVGMLKWLPTLSSVDRVVKAFNRVSESEEALSLANRKLDQQHKELQSILRNSPDIIFRVDPVGRITFISEAIRNYGYEPDTLMGGDLVRLIHPDDQGEIVEDFGTPFDGYELDARQYTVRLIVRKQPDGSNSTDTTHTRLFLISIDDIAVGDQLPADGGIRQGIARDMTELQDMREKVSKLQAMVPICSCCKSVRNDEGYWERVEEYIQKEVEAPLSHSICPECLKANYGDVPRRSSKTG